VKLFCATTNQAKLREFCLAAHRFAPGWLEVEPIAGLSDIAPPSETGSSFEENATEKALYYSFYSPGLLFADDSGIEVRALGGAPGVASARFAGPRADDASNNQLLLEKLQGVTDRTARFVCVIVLAERGRLIDTFRGEIEGQILHEPRGTNGFGYDPLFFYPPLACTLAELTSERKLEVSHRGLALAKMIWRLSACRK